MAESWSQQEVRAFALEFPDAAEQSHMGTPDARVRNRIFVAFPTDGRTVSLKCTPIGLDMLVRSDPGTYSDAWGGRWVRVVLDRVDPAELRTLLLEAYCLAAPKRLGREARLAAG